MVDLTLRLVHPDCCAGYGQGFGDADARGRGSAEMVVTDVISDPLGRAGQDSWVAAGCQALAQSRIIRVDTVDTPFTPSNVLRVAQKFRKPPW